MTARSTTSVAGGLTCTGAGPLSGQNEAEPTSTPSFGWLRHLPPPDRVRFLDELHAALRRGVAANAYDEVDRLIAEWRNTARLHESGVAEKLARPIDLAAPDDDLDFCARIRMLRKTYGLSLEDAKRIDLQARGEDVDQKVLVSELEAGLEEPGQ